MSKKKIRALRTACCFATFVVFLALTVTMSPSTVGQENKPAQRVGVDLTDMGHYRALAELIFRALRSEDLASAAKLARILEVSWDKGGMGCRETAWFKSCTELGEEIDRAMDAFINPIMAYSKKHPEAASIQIAYDTYLGKLRLADEYLAKTDAAYREYYDKLQTVDEELQKKLEKAR